MIILEIDEPLPSLNSFWHGHWSKKTALRKRWAWLVRAAILNAKITIKPNYARAKVTVTRYGARRLDDDNIRGGGKMMIDSLVKEGLLKDDSPDVIGSPEFRQIIGTRARKTVVEIEAI